MSSQEWNTLVASDEFKRLAPEQREQQRVEYFDKKIAPTLSPEQLPKHRAFWDRATLPKPTPVQDQKSLVPQDKPAAFTGNDEDRDSAWGYSVDRAQQLAGRGVQAIGGATGMESVEGLGRSLVERQERDIAEGGYQPKYQGSLTQNFEDGGVGQALGWTGEKLAENWATTGATLVGGLAALATSPFSAPAALAIGAGTTGLSYLMGTGEAAQEFDEHGIEGQTADRVAMGVGAGIAALDRFGAGKVLPKAKLTELAKNLGKMSGAELVGELRSAGAKEVADSIEKAILAAAGATKRGLAEKAVRGFGFEGATETAQEALMMGAAAVMGGEYETREVVDRFIDSFVLGGVMGAAASPVGGSYTPEQERARLLQDPNATPAQRLQAARVIAKEYEKASPAIAGAFLNHATKRITTKKPFLDEGESFYQSIRPVERHKVDQELLALPAPQDMGHAPIAVPSTNNSQIDGAAAFFGGGFESQAPAFIRPSEMTLDNAKTFVKSATDRLKAAQAAGDSAAADRARFEVRAGLNALESVMAGKAEKARQELEAQHKAFVAQYRAGALDTPPALPAPQDMESRSLLVDDSGDARRATQQDMDARERMGRLVQAIDGAKQADVSTRERALADVGKQLRELRAESLQTPPNPARDELQTLIAKLGGLNIEEARAQGIDPAQFAARPGLRNPFRREGVSFDQMAESLSQLGFFQGRNYSANELLDMLDNSVRGNPVFAPAAAEHQGKIQNLLQTEQELGRAKQAVESKIGNLTAEEVIYAGELYDMLKAGASIEDVEAAAAALDYTGEEYDLFFENLAIITEARNGRLSQQNPATARPTTETGGREGDTGGVPAESPWPAAGGAPGQSKPDQESGQPSAPITQVVAPDAAPTTPSESRPDQELLPVPGPVVQGRPEGVGPDTGSGQTNAAGLPGGAVAPAVDRPPTPTEQPAEAAPQGAVSVSGVRRAALSVAQEEDGTSAAAADGEAGRPPVQSDLVGAGMPKVATTEQPSAVDQAAHEAAASPRNDRPEPTDAQKKAGNYKVGKIRLHGLEISIENPRGSTRSGTAPDGSRWENTMAHHYGYFNRTKGRDGDHLDVFLTEGAEDMTRPVFVVDQIDPGSKRFDEHKVVMGAVDEAEARAAYLANYQPGWQGLGGVRAMSLEDFKAWLASGDTTKRLTDRNEGGRKDESNAPTDSVADPNEFVAAPDGSLAFGEISPEIARAIGRQAGEIRLPIGIHRADGTGYGLVHIEAKHGKQIRNAGFESVTNFVSHVAKDFQEVRRAQARQLLVAVKDGREDVMYIQLEPSKEDDYYRINTAFPARADYLEKQGRRGYELLWDGSEPASAATEKQPLSAGSPESGLGQDAPIAQGQSKSSVAQTSPLADTSDVGGEMGGNRRQKGFSLQDIRNAGNDTERVAMAVKAKVWERPDYQALVDSGVSPVIAHLVKQIYDAIPTKPKHSADKYLYAYVEGVEAAREAVSEFLADSAAQGDMVMAAARTAQLRGTADPLDAAGLSTFSQERVNAARNWFLDRLFPKRNGERWGKDNEAGQTRGNALGNKFIAQIQIGRGEIRKAMKAVDEGFPTKQEAWQRSYEVVEKDGRFALKRKRASGALETFDTRDAAVERAREMSRQQREEGFKEPETSPEKSVREGKDIRQGRNVSTEELRGAIGLAKVNFGNWMQGAAKAGERQAHTNSAYDALHDLAGILNLPPKAMSLNGTLSVAFGAQGKGRFAAHFVPGLNEINLTRNTGAGTLAHEWAHALDHYFGVQAGLAKKADPFLSAFATIPENAEIRPEIVNAFRSIHDAMAKMETSLPPEQFEAERKTAVERSRKYLESWLDSVIQRATAGRPKEEIADFNRALDRLRTGRVGDRVPLGKSANYVNEATDALREAYKALTGRYFSADTAAAISANSDLLATAIDVEKFGKIHSPQRVVSTQYMRNARQKESKSGKRYWSTPWEMFARAFEMYVVDKLAENEARNDYLTAAWKSVETEADARRMDGVAQEAMIRYPQGDERRRINAAFDVLVSTLETRETDKGLAIQEPVGLYSGYEREASNLPGRERGARISEPPDGIGRPGQLDLFNPPGADKRQAFSDIFGTIVKPQAVSYLKAATDTVASAEDLAHLVASLRKEPQEVFLAVAADANGKVLRVIRHTKGLKASSQVDPLTVVAEVASIDGAATLHYAHNHPSGVATPSADDKAITDVLNDMLDGTGINPGFHIVIASVEKGLPSWAGVDSGEGLTADTGKVLPRIRKAMVPVTERKMVRRGTLGEPVTSPAAALEATRQHDNAIFLLDNQHRPVAIVPMAAHELKALRAGGRVRRILAAMDKSNASAAIVKSQDRGAADNVTRMLKSYGSGVRVLDALVAEDGRVVSLAETGSLATSGAFFRAGGPMATPVAVTLQDADNVTARITLDWSKAVAKRLRTVSRFADLPAAVQDDIRDAGGNQRTKGIFHVQSSTVYVIAENHSSLADVEETVFHEAYGHLGLSGLFGKDIKVKMNELWMAIGGDKGIREAATRNGINLEGYFRGADSQVVNRKLTTESRNRLMMEELLAHLAQDQRPSIRKRVSELAGAVRQWLRKHGFLATSKLSDGELFVLLRRSKEAIKTNMLDKSFYIDSAPMFRAGDEAFAQEVLSELAEVDDLFRYPVSDKQDLAAIMEEVYIGSRFVGDDTRPEERRDSGADKRHLFRNEYGDDFHVYETDDSVWIDVSRFETGSKGAGVYAAVSNYAYNTGKEFVGDPEGLSEDAIVRRTSNMLSSALRFGTTDHLKPAPEQLRGIPEKGIPPLAWRGTDVDKVQALIDTFLATAHNQFPEIKGYRYDFSARRFVDRRGRPLESVRFANAGAASVGRPYKAGRSTLRRIIFIQSLVSSESGARPGILQQVLVGSHSLVKHGGLSALFRQGDSSFSPPNSNTSNSSPAGDSAVLFRTADDVMAEKLGLGPRPGLADKIRDWKNRNFRQAADAAMARAYEGAFDGLIGLKRAEDLAGKGAKAGDYSGSGYVGARMATGVADTMHAILHYGAPMWRDGVLEYKPGTKGLLEIFEGLGNDLNAWLGWMAGNRGAELMAQGRENNLTQEDIDALLALSKGKEQAFQGAKAAYNTLNQAMLDMAEQAGLIDGSARADWESEWYVPFYRVSDADGDLSLLAPRTKRGLSHQTAGIKRLKGGDASTGDLLENIITNWLKLTDSSMKNMALLKSVNNLRDTDFISDETVRWQQVVVSKSEIAKRIKSDRKTMAAVAEFLGMGDGATLEEVANELAKVDNEGFEKLWGPVAPKDPDIIRVQRNGRNEYYRVNDASLLRAITHLQSSGFNDPVTRAGRWFKRLLTTGVTASPDFILRNFIRDAAHAWAINPDRDHFTFGKDSLKGVAAALKEDPSYRELMFAGASFQGGYVHGTDPEASAQIIRRALERKGLSAGQIDAHMGSLLDTPAKLHSAVMRGWQAYRELGDKVENANRLATFKAARAAGKSLAQAVFEAKDLMDYSLRGNFQALVWLTDVVPFLNARLQGLSKLGRAGKADPRAVGMAMGKIALFSVFLAALNDDDEKYQGLPDWEKDAYWHVWIGDDHWRIPKPFEIGILAGTLPERIYHAWLRDNQPPEKVRQAMVHAMAGTLSFNPLPQAIIPAVETWGNRSFFFDTPIEGMADQGKRPEDRYDAHTSTSMVGLGQLFGVSPKKLQHLWEGYTGTMGTYALAVTDMLVRGGVGLATGGGAPRPAWSVSDLPAIKSFYRGDAPARNTQYITDLYDRLEEVNQIHRAIQDYRKYDPEKARDLLAEEGGKLRYRPMLSATSQRLADLRRQRKRIMSDPKMTAAAKKQMLDGINAQINRLAAQAGRATEAAF